MDLELFSGCHHLFEVPPGVALQAEHHLAARNAFLQDLAVRKKLIADRGADEVGSVGVEPVLHQQIDVPEVDEPQIDRDLLRLSPLRHPPAIHIPSTWMENAPTRTLSSPAPGDKLMKIANRITSGVILAALIVGASLMMGIQTSWTLFGYPASPSSAPLRGGGRRLPPLQHLHPGQAQ